MDGILVNLLVDFFFIFFFDRVVIAGECCAQWPGNELQAAIVFSFFSLFVVVVMSINTLMIFEQNPPLIV